jgi:uncharacterized membrane protein
MLSLVGSFHSVLQHFCLGSRKPLARALRSVAPLSAALLLALPAAAQLQQLRNHVRSAVVSKQATYVSSMTEDQTMNLSIVLPLRNQAELSDLISRLYDPSSPDYRHFLSVEEFTARFAPTAADYQAVVAFAQSSGFTVTQASPNRLVVPLRGTVAQVNAAFNVRMSVYRHPTEDRTFFSPDREPSLDLAVPVAHIAGLNNYALPQPTLLQSPNQAIANVTGSGPGGSYLGSDMRKAYYGGSTLTGQGQSVGIVSFVGYAKSDVDLTFSNAGQSYSVPINNVLLDGNTTGTANNYSSEPVLDIVQAIGMAPSLDQVRVYIGYSDVDILNSMATENIAKQLSCSWSWWPDDPAQDDPIFQEFAAQGQSFLAASGDYGAFDVSFNRYVYPQEDAFVTSVGGTHLTTSSAGGAWSSESSWNSQGYGSTGGISPDSIPLPSYQDGLATATNGGSATVRNVPDVAMEGDFDNYLCNGGQCGQTGAGTSFAAPRWAGFLALVNQQAVKNGNAPSGGIGFLNPSLYSIGTSSSFTTDFHDITVGNNLTENQSTWFSAVTGYDLVTGWGSPTGQHLIDALAGPQVPGFWLQSSQASVGVAPGKSSTATITVSDSGGFTGSVAFSVSGLPSGVTASWSPTSATDSSVLTLTASSSITAAATATVTITGTSGSLTATTKVTVSVQVPTFTLSNGSAVDLGIGHTATTSVTVNPLYGFTDSVTFSVSGLPSGVTASFSPSASASGATLTFTADSTASAGASTVTITGTSGTITVSNTLTLTLHQPSFTLYGPSAIDVGLSTSNTAFYSIQSSYSFSGNVTLSASGLPTGVTASFSPNPGSSYSNLTLAADSSATIGSYTITINGVSGSLTSSATLTVNIRNPSFTLYGPTFVDVGAGASANGWVWVQAVYGFNSPVTFSVSGLPTGVSAVFSPNPATGSSTVTFNAASSAVIGSYPLTITGVSGSLTATTALTLNVRQTSFDLSTNGNLDIGQGASGQSFVYIQPSYGFNGSVAMSLSGLPTGTTALWSPNPTTNSTVLTVTAASTTPVGSYPLTITGTSGSLVKTAALTLGVHVPTFTISTTPAITVGQGATAQAYASVYNQYGFTGSVTLTASGLPAGVTATFSPNPTTGYSTLTFTAASTAVTGQYNITVTGTSGSLKSTSSITLTVAAPSFTVQTYSVVSVGQGATATAWVTVYGNNGFSGNVTLAASGLPAGVTATFSPNPATNYSTATFSASSTAASGQYTVTITGTSGSLTASTTLTLTVQVPTFTLSTFGTMDIGQGVSTPFNVYIQPNYGFSGNVTLSVTGLPAGVTASFSPNPVASNSSGTVTFTASSDAVLGQYTITLIGKSGSQTVSNTITLVIHTPTFYLWGSGSVVLGQGTSGSAYIGVTSSYGFSSPITFTASGLPTGVTASFSPNPSTSYTNVTFTAAGDAPLGQYSVTITGTAGTVSSSVTYNVGVYQQSFALSAYPSTVALNPGATVNSFIYVNGSYGFSNPVTFTVNGLPTGVSATFSLNPSNSVTAVTFTAAADAAPGSSNITISGTSGALTASAAIALTVNTPGFNLAVAPARITIAPGATAVSTVTNSPTNGFTGDINLGVTGLPDGVTATISPNPATSTATVTLTAAGSAQPAAVTATITGTSGAASGTVPLAVTVPAAPSTTTTTLTATAGGKTAGTVSPGTTVTLTASVTSGSTGLTAGQVIFCEDSAPSCNPSQNLAAVQLTSASTAVWRFVPAPGSHSIHATFLGVTGQAASTSASAAFSVTSSAAASSTLLSQSGSPGNYALTAVVSGPGKQSPSGTVSFLDTSSANASLGSGALQPADATLSVSSVQTAATGQGPNKVASADFNGDGIPDLAVINYGSGTLTVFLGKGDGTFSAVSTAQAVGGSPDAIVAGDFNRDGRIDLAIACYSTSSITVLLGNGNGTFTPTTQSPSTGSVPSSMTSGDFNGDGLLDLAVTSTYDSAIHIFLGDGSGAFTAVQQTVAAGNNPFSVAVGDFNGDGVPDLAVTNFYDSTVHIYLGNGDGTFSAFSTLSTGSYPRQVATADLDGDGKLDLVVLNSYSGNPYNVFLGAGDGTFTAQPAPASLQNSPAAFAMGDFNGDGKLDLAVTLSETSAVSFLFGAGDGTFTVSPVTGSTGQAPVSIISSDFNGDGSPDLAIVNATDNTLSILSGQTIQSASVTVSGIAPSGSGNHVVQASYPGDTNYTASSSNTLVLGAQPGPPQVTVTPATYFVSTTQTLAVTVTVAAGSGSPTSGGTLRFTGGLYSNQVTLSGGTASFTIPAGSLMQGTDVLTAVYTPDSTSAGYYTASTGYGWVTVTAPVGTAQPTIAVTATPAIVTDQQTASMVVSVAGQSGLATPTGNVLLFGGGTSMQMPLISGSATFSIAPTLLTAGSNTFTAYYSGDTNYNNGSATGSVTLSSFSVAVGAPPSVSAGAASTATVTISAGSGYSGTVNLACTLTASPTGAKSVPTCTLSPASLALTAAGTSMATLTINTTAASTTAALHPDRSRIWSLGLGAPVLALVVFLGVPARRRRWLSMLVLLAGLVAAGGIGCGGGGGSTGGTGGGGGGGGGITTPATTAGKYTFTITATDSANSSIKATTSAVVTVQ